MFFTCLDSPDFSRFESVHFLPSLAFKPCGTFQGDLSIHNGMVGYCGGTAAEVVDTPGVALCNSPGPSPSPAPSPTGGSCLCVFDIDRTLTGAQGVAGPGSTCPGNKVINNVWDSAYSQGWLTLSEAAQKLQQTFCNECFLGIVSHGDASGHGSPERDFILKNVLNSVPFRRLKREQPEASVWSSHTVSSPLVLRWPDKLKQDAARLHLKTPKSSMLGLPEGRCRALNKD